MTPKELAAMDQSLKLIVETFPPMWRQLYTNLINEGFTEQQAFELLKTFILKP